MSRKCLYFTMEGVSISVLSRYVDWFGVARAPTKRTEPDDLFCTRYRRTRLAPRLCFAVAAFQRARLPTDDIYLDLSLLKYIPDDVERFQSFALNISLWRFYHHRQIYWSVSPPVIYFPHLTIFYGNKFGFTFSSRPCIMGNKWLCQPADIARESLTMHNWLLASEINMLFIVNLIVYSHI